MPLTTIRADSLKRLTEEEDTYATHMHPPDPSHTDPVAIGITRGMLLGIFHIAA